MLVKRITLICLSLAILTPAAGSEQETLRTAEKYFRADRRGDFKALAAKIDKNSVVAPLFAYWGGRLDLRRDDDDAAQEFLATSDSPYLRDEIRRRLLETYANKNNWRAFAGDAAQGGDCAVALAGFTGGEQKASEKTTALLHTLWRAERRFSNPLCTRLYKFGKRAGALTDDDIWRKLRTLAGDKQLSASRRLLRLFPGYISYQKVRKVANRAVRYIRGKHGLGTRAGRELVMIAAMAAVRRKPKTALSRWKKFSPYFSKTENAHVWTVLAEWAARWHREDALSLYKRAGENYENYATDNSRAWHVRAALRAGDCAETLRATAAMGKEQRGVSAWRYWRAICLERQPHDAVQGDSAAAQKELRALAADEDDYYGLLAREATNFPLTKPPPPEAVQPPPAPAQVDGDFARALALYRAGLKSLAFKMWKHAIKDEAATDARLLAAAQQAAALEWNLASINAANEADSAAAHAVRFPLPYRGDITKYSRKFSLDEAFVYGLIRQESRFMPKIVSSANARGLMQVIPRTARLVARQHGYTRYKLSRLTRVDTNIIIGTTYLADLADRLNAEPAKVAAGYNAGPGRVRRWYAASPEILVAIENIPLTETRLYVKHVLANRLHYSLRLNLPQRPFSTLLTLPMRVAAVTPEAEKKEDFPKHFALVPPPNSPAGR